MDHAGVFNTAEAQRLDSANELARFRDRFYIPPGTVYMDGNSLGLLSKDAEKSLLRVLDEWKNLGIGGWMNAKNPWFWFAEKIGARAAGLFGAEKDEVIFTGTTTVNIHTLTGSFFRPEGKRTKILADELNFPSDLYALKGQLKLKDLDPDKNLILASPDVKGFLDENKLISLMDEETALVFLPSVIYRNGQLLDIEKLTQAAHERNIPIGFDCSHSAGVIPHEFNRWGVDFALWCSYKYLNGGPGAAAFIYVNRKHLSLQPSLPGWFGNNKEKQFDMLTQFIPAETAGKWQISSPGILGSAPMEGAIEITIEAGIERIRKTSLRLTDFLAGSLKSKLISKYKEFNIVTPSEHSRRGGHIALSHPRAAGIYERLLSKSIITDFRPPDIIRIAPVPLYNTFAEVDRVVEALSGIMDKGV
jgi:kynureninase